MELTKDEKKLIEYLRTMTFEEVIEASTAIDEKNARMSRKAFKAPFYKEVASVCGRLDSFTDLLCNANENYKKEVSILDQD